MVVAVVEDSRKAGNSETTDINYIGVAYKKPVK